MPSIGTHLGEPSGRRNRLRPDVKQRSTKAEVIDLGERSPIIGAAWATLGRSTKADLGEPAHVRHGSSTVEAAELGPQPVDVDVDGAGSAVKCAQQSRRPL
jgi:hypothetical protein